MSSFSTFLIDLTWSATLQFGWFPVNSTTVDINSQNIFTKGRGLSTTFLVFRTEISLPNFFKPPLNGALSHPVITPYVTNVSRRLGTVLTKLNLIKQISRKTRFDIVAQIGLNSNSDTTEVNKHFRLEENSVKHKQFII